MQTTYIFGHKIPDTDSVCSSIALSYLKNKLGDNTEPRVLGSLNRETKFVLDYFKIEEPKFLNDVKVRIRNMHYNKDAYIEEHTSIFESYKKMEDLGVTGLPLVDRNNKLTGYVNVKEISKFLIDEEATTLDSSYSSLMTALKGKEITRYDEEIKGNIIIATYQSKTFIETIKLTNEDILIVGDRYKIQEYAVNSAIKLLILVNKGTLPKELLEIAKKNKINVISTPFNTFKCSNQVRLSNVVKRININEKPVSFDILDYRNDFVDITNKYGHTNYPIIDKKNNCLGMVRLVDVNTFQKQKVILVDHNQAAQSVDGIEEAEIVEIVDHHNLSTTLMTSTPINFRISPVGCTCTLLYRIYNEAHVDIPKNMAGIMLASIISDTLLFKSPTTTKVDIEAAKELATIAGLDVYKFGTKMFEASTSVANMSVEEIIHSDMKTFKFDKVNMVIGQTNTMEFKEVAKREKEIVASLNSICKIGNANIALLFVTDIIKNGSYIFFNEDSKDLLCEAYGIDNIKQGHYIDGVVSRKKQMLPPLIEVIERK